LSARAAAQLELIGFADVAHYARGKTDWLVRGLPMEPRASIGERVRVLRFFINNLAPALRGTWIRVSRRAIVGASTNDDIAHLSPDDAVAPAPAGASKPRAVVLDKRGVLLGAIQSPAPAARAFDAMNPAPQTIRPDMTPELATALMGSDPYLLVTTAHGKFLGRHSRPRGGA
jgi:hypothetical protein